MHSLPRPLRISPILLFRVQLRQFRKTNMMVIYISSAPCAKKGWWLLLPFFILYIYIFYLTIGRFESICTSSKWMPRTRFTRTAWSRTKCNDEEQVIHRLQPVYPSKDSFSRIDAENDHYGSPGAFSDNPSPVDFPNGKVKPKPKPTKKSNGMLLAPFGCRLWWFLNSSRQRFNRTEFKKSECLRLFFV